MAVYAVGLQTDELALPWCCLMLGSGLPSIGLRLLPPWRARRRSKGRPTSGCSATVHAATIIVAGLVGAFSVHGVVAIGAGEAPMPRLLGERGG
jgi:hypothetical protein